MTEISDAELQALNTVVEAADKAGMLGTLGDNKTPRGSFFSIIGADATTRLNSLGVISIDDYKATVQRWQVKEVPTGGGEPVDRPPTLMETSQALYIGRLARMKLGIEGKAASSSPALPSLPTPTATSSTSARKIKMNQILSQLDESEVEIVSSAVQLTCFARYETLYGKNQRPHPDQEPSIEQLSGLKALLDSTATPYADFAIFQPHAARIMKKIRFHGLVLNKAGALAPAELFGPPDIDSWRSCYDVWANAMVMLDAIDLGSLQAYKSRIEMLSVRYGDSKVWPLLYQADTRARLEHLPRKRLELLKEHQDAQAAGNSTQYEVSRPWNLSLSCVAKDDRFWSHEFIEPAMIILSEGKGVKPLIDEDAKVASQTEKSRSVSATAASAVRPRNQNRTGRVHDLVDGQYRSNRTGHPFCSDYNSGKCTSTVQGSWCGVHQSKAHQCARCLGTHPMTSCPHTEPPQPGWIKSDRSKGKSRGKGKSGKGRHKGSAPY